jgi:two-component system phosphate regulon response regulator PhoB
VSGERPALESKAVILIIEDDAQIQEMLAYALAKEGWKLLRAGTGEEGVALAKKERVDCVLLDIMLPGMDGLKTLKKIKEIEHCRDTPVIITSAKGEDADVITGLELGADDYVIKPYSPKVLIARARAAIRRKEEKNAVPQTDVLSRGGIKLDAARHEVFLREERLELIATEFALLKHFLLYPDIVFSRDQLISAVKGPDHPVTDRSIDVQILGIRRKLGDAGAMIETVRGVGYRFRVAQ